MLSGEARHDRDGGTLEEIQEFYRLFMVPGMAHCGGGDGANVFGNGVNAPVVDADHDLLKALERWVEQGGAPQEIIANSLREQQSHERRSVPTPALPLPASRTVHGRRHHEGEQLRMR